MFRILKNLVTPVGTLEDILIKAAEENLELILKVEMEKNVYQYVPISNNDVSYVRKSMAEYLDRDFYYYVLDNCLFFEQI